MGPWRPITTPPTADVYCILVPLRPVLFAVNRRPGGSRCRHAGDRRLPGLNGLGRGGDHAGMLPRVRVDPGYRCVRHAAPAREHVDRRDGRPFRHHGAREERGRSPQPVGGDLADTVSSVIALS